MKATKRGTTLIIALFGLGASAVLFRDIFLFITFMIVFVLIDAEILWTIFIASRPNNSFQFGRESRPQEQPRSKNFVPAVKRSAALGQTVVSDFVFESKTRSSSVSLNVKEIPFLKLEPREFSNAKKEPLRFEFRSPFAGLFRASSIEAKLIGPLKLFESRVKLDVSLEYDVYPRTFDIALASSKILGKGGGIGEIPTEFPGIGTEFYDTREYISGDDIRNINWNASARLGKLYVNDRQKEVGASYLLVFDPGSRSFFDRDRLASTFLQCANTLSILGINFGLLVLRGGREVVFSKAIGRSFDSLNYARDAALLFTTEGRKEVSEQLISPISSHTLSLNRESLTRNNGPALLSEMEVLARHQMVASQKQNDAQQAIIQLVRENASEPPAVVYIGAISSFLAPLVELSSELKRGYNAEFVALDPTEPWITAQSETEGVKLYETRQRNLKVLGSSGVRYLVGDPLEIAEQLFSY